MLWLCRLDDPGTEAPFIIRQMNAEDDRAGLLGLPEVRLTANSAFSTLQEVKLFYLSSFYLTPFR